MNGGEEQPFAGEDRILVPSPKVATYDLQPEMSAPELTDKLVAAITSGKYDLIIANFAHPDMVGHTGSLPAAITELGRAPCRERVCPYVSISVGAVSLKTKTNIKQHLRDHTANYDDASTRYIII